MSSARKVRNFHVPLPEELYERLRRESRRSRTPATEIARQGIAEALRRRQKAALHAAIRGYAAAQAGTAADLDPDLEAASLDTLLDAEE